MSIWAIVGLIAAAVVVIVVVIYAVFIWKAVKCLLKPFDRIGKGY